jgi:hypothetical protein
MAWSKRSLLKQEGARKRWAEERMEMSLYAYRAVLNYHLRRWMELTKGRDAVQMDRREKDEQHPHLSWS